MPRRSAQLESGGEAGHGIVAGPDRVAVTGTSRWQKVIGLVGVVVVLWVGGDLVDIVTADGGGPGRAGPGGQGPSSDAPAGDVTSDGDQAPPGGGAHDPSEFDHG